MVSSWTSLSTFRNLVLYWFHIASQFGVAVSSPAAANTAVVRARLLSREVGQFVETQSERELLIATSSANGLDVLLEFSERNGLLIDVTVDFLELGLELVPHRFESWLKNFVPAATSTMSHGTSTCCVALHLRSQEADLHQQTCATVAPAALAVQRALDQEYPASDFCRGSVLREPKSPSFTNRLCNCCCVGASRTMRSRPRRPSFTRRFCEFDLRHWHIDGLFRYVLRDALRNILEHLENFFHDLRHWQVALRLDFLFGQEGRDRSPSGCSAGTTEPKRARWAPAAIVESTWLSK